MSDLVKFDEVENKIIELSETFKIIPTKLQKQCIYLYNQYAIV